MRVAQVIGRFTRGGAQHVASELRQALAQRGVDSIGIALRNNSINGSTDSTADGELIDLGVSRQTASILRGVVRFRRVLRDHATELVHVHGRDSLMFVSFALLGCRKPRICFTWHDSSSVLRERGLKRIVLARSIRSCDKVFASSHGIAERLRDKVRLPETPAVLRNGVTVVRETTGRDAKIPLIVWVGRLVPPKDPQVLLRAAAMLRKKGLTFKIVIAGDSLPNLEWFVRETKELACRLALDDVVTFPGWVERPQDLLARAAIGVQSSHTEGLSMSLLEQMMAGLAVVATNVGDTAIAIEHDSSGLLFNPGDESALAASLHRLVINPALRTRLGCQARRVALAEFSVEAMADRAIRDYERILQVT